MNSSEIEQLRQKLMGLRAELLKREKAWNETSAPGEPDQDGIGSPSRRTAIQRELTAQKSSRQNKRRLQKIDGALRRIENGEYGRCFVCEEDLDARRLSEDPTITRCANCAEE